MIPRCNSQSILQLFDTSVLTSFVLTLRFSLPLQRTSLGRELLERVFYHLNLEEREYFGLKYLDVNSVCQWLDPLKEVKKQSKDKGATTDTDNKSTSVL